MFQVNWTQNVSPINKSLFTFWMGSVELSLKTWATLMPVDELFQTQHLKINMKDGTTHDSLNKIVHAN